ncbi:MAG: PDZ domain-containing protein [Gemmataceae bacterium]
MASVPGPGTKPNTNVTVVVVPTGLLGGFNGLGGGRPPVVVNPQPLVVPQPVVVNPEPVVVPQPVVTPEPVQTTGGTETPAVAGNANALRVKERFLDGAAAQAGIQLGDILIAAGGKRLKTVEDLEAVAAMKVKLDVVYLDSTNNKLATCQLTGDGASFGVAVDPVAIDLEEEEEQPAETEQAIPEGTPTALQITEVTPRGPAARAGLQVGDVIVAIGGKRVETIEALNAALLRGIEVEVLFVNPEDGKAETRKLKVTAEVGLSVKRIAVAEK